MPIKKFSISNIFIIISILFTIIGYYSNFFIGEWGINNYYLNNGNYIHYTIQAFSGTFIHSGFAHLFMNSIFVYYFGNIVEIILGKVKYIVFFILFVIFNGIVLAYTNTSNVIGISGFAISVLTYYTLELKKQNNPEYKGGITAIILNLAIGLYPGISLLGHFNGAIFGIIFYYLNNDFLGRQFIGLFKYPKIKAQIIRANPLNTKKN